MPDLKFEVQGRNGYYSIDEYRGESCQRFVDSFKTRKLANAVASELNNLARRINELEGEQ